jgi:hypothetical protein
VAALFVLLWLVVPAAIGVLLGALPRPNARRFCLVVAVPLVLAAGTLALAWYAAPSTRPEDGCSGCQYAYGRWWEAEWSAFLVGVPASSWIVGALVGVWVRAIVDSTRAQRARATR